MGQSLEYVKTTVYIMQVNIQTVFGQQKTIFVHFNYLKTLILNIIYRAKEIHHEVPLLKSESCIVISLNQAHYYAKTANRSVLYVTLQHKSIILHSSYYS